MQGAITKVTNQLSPYILFTVLNRNDFFFLFVYKELGLQPVLYFNFPKLSYYLIEPCCMFSRKHSLSIEKLVYSSLRLPMFTTFLPPVLQPPSVSSNEEKSIQEVFEL